jgi:hypothetical protein
MGMERGREIHTEFLLCSSLELDVISEARQPLQMPRLDERSRNQFSSNSC